MRLKRHSGFIMNPELDIDALTLDLARQMLVHECDLRKSDEIQDVYTLIQNGMITEIEFVENYVQYSTIEKFGYNPSNNSLINYRMIHKKFGNDVKDYAFYLRYNIMKEILMPGTVVNTSNIDLIDFSSKELVKFENVARNNGLSLIFSGSIT